MKVFRLAAQGLTWIAFAALIGTLAQWPVFTPQDTDQALLRISMSHLSERLEPCRQLSEAERAELPPTRRVSEICTRGRALTRLVLDVNGSTWLDQTITPAGLANDGRSYLMTEFAIPAGKHSIEVRIYDSAEPVGPDLQQHLKAHLEAGRVTVLEISDRGIVL